jgi:alpha-tubulin suppressor-like RCC1 family protein
MKRLTLIFCLFLATPASAAVVGFGNNEAGQLGAGFHSAAQSPIGTRVSGPVKEVSAGAGGNFALMQDGTLEAWGYNALGNLCSGTHTREQTTPFAVPGVFGVAQVSTFGSHVMILLDNETVETCGSNLYGELGNGTSSHGHEKGANTNSATPLLVQGLTGVRYIDTGGTSDYAVLSNGTVMAWGENKSGQLGDGTKVERDRPVLMQGLSNVVQIVGGGFPGAGGHYLARLANGTVLAGGRNDQGQLGNGTTSSSTTPVAVQGVAGASSVSADISHSLVLVGSTALAFGGNTYGQLGFVGEGCGASTCSRVARPVPLQSVTAISAGFRYSLAISNGKPFAWGVNGREQLGDGTKLQHNSPTPVLEVQEATAISAGLDHAVAIVKVPLAPLIEAMPGPGSIVLHWRGGPETKPWHLSVRPVTKPTSPWGPGILLPPASRSFTIKGLSPVPLEVSVKDVIYGVRVISATPNP